MKQFWVKLEMNMFKLVQTCMKLFKTCQNLSDFFLIGPGKTNIKIGPGQNKCLNWSLTCLSSIILTAYVLLAHDDQILDLEPSICTKKKKKMA